MMGTVGRAALAVVAAATLVACTAERRPAPEPVASPSDSASVVVAADDAADLRLSLEEDFVVTAHLVGELGRATGRERPALENALHDTTGGVRDELLRGYPGRRVDRFLASWRRYIGALTEGGDPGDARSPVRASEDLADAMAELTDNGIDVAGTARLLRQPARAVVRARGAFTEGNYERAYTRQRQAHAGMAAVGRAFSAAVAEHQADDFPGARTSGPIELRSALRQLLSEHTLLLGTVVRRGSRAARDFDAAAAALNGNTEDLVEAVGSVYPDVRDEFARTWRARISNLAAYTAAAVDQPRKRAASQRAAHVEERNLARLLAEASDDHIGGDALRPVLRVHTRAVVRVADTYIDRDFEASEGALHDAVSDGAAIADLIADGMVEHDPEAFGGP